MTNHRAPAHRHIQITIDPRHVATVDHVGRAIEACFGRWLQTAGRPGGGVDNQRRFRFPAGLVPDVVRELEKDAWAVTVDDHHVPVAVDDGVVRAAAGTGRRMLEAITTHARGHVEVRDWHDLLAFLAQVAAVFPAAAVVVAAPTRRVAWSLWQALTARLRHPVGLVTTKSRKPGRRCIVCTYRSLKEVAVAAPAILVFVEAERAADALTGRPDAGWSYARVYGAVYAAVTRDARTDLRLRALTGDIICSTAATPQGGLVFVVEAAGPAPAVGTPQGALDRKRRLIWGNRARNRLIASLARAAAAGDPVALGECGVHVAAAALAQNGRRVVVVVESTAHARKLRSLLRGWPVLDKSPQAPSGARPAAAPDPAAPGNHVVTLTYAATEGVVGDVVVWATGGAGMGAADFVGDASAVHLYRRPLVVDVADTFDERARLDGQRRIREYANRGWLVTEPPRRPPAG